MSWAFQPIPSGGVGSASASYTLTADCGVFALAGQDVALKRALRLVADGGNFTLSGQDVSFRRALRLTAECGVYVFSGQDVSFGSGLTLDTEPGAFTLSGQDVAFRRSYRLVAEPGIFALNGQTVQFSATLTSIIGVGNRFYTGRATYWPRDVDDGYGGWAYGSAVRYAVRWEEWVEERFDDKGDRFVSKAVVWLPEVVEAGAYLFKGLSEVADPTGLNEAFVIRQVVVTPSLRGDSNEIRVYL